MPAIQIPGQHIFYVRWSCRKCGHSAGVAKTTIPFPKSALSEDVVRNLFDALKQKLPKVHARQGCIATIEDFRIERGTSEDAKIVGLV
jgi:hypothetical protein